jgi:hypothetical protein
MSRTAVNFLPLSQREREREQEEAVSVSVWACSIAVTCRSRAAVQRTFPHRHRFYTICFTRHVFSS